MTFEQITEAAKSQNWGNRKLRDALFTAGLKSRFDEALAAIGRPRTPQPATSVAQPPSIAPLESTHASVPKFGNMTLKFPAKDVLTGRPLAAGTRVIGLKVGGGWDFTTEPIGVAEFRKLREAMLLSLDPDEGGTLHELDHEDYRLLEDFGNRYPEVAAMIGVAVPGLED